MVASSEVINTLDLCFWDLGKESGKEAEVVEKSGHFVTGIVGTLHMWLDTYFSIARQNLESPFILWLIYIADSDSDPIPVVGS